MAPRTRDEATRGARTVGHALTVNRRARTLPAGGPAPFPPEGLRRARAGPGCQGPAEATATRQHGGAVGPDGQWPAPRSPERWRGACVAAPAHWWVPQRLSRRSGPSESRTPPGAFCNGAVQRTALEVVHNMAVVFTDTPAAVTGCAQEPVIKASLCPSRRAL